MNECDLIRKLLECCRNASGAYAILLDTNVHIRLPGYKRCVDNLTEVIKEADEFLRQ